MSKNNKKNNNEEQNKNSSHCGCDTQCESSGLPEEQPCQTPECACQQNAEKIPSVSVGDAVEQMTREEQNLNLVELLQRLEQANSAAEKNKDLYVRAVADLDNYRRKVQREKEELAKFAISPLLEDMLQPLDHLEMAIAAAKAANEAPSLTTGVEMVCAQVNKVLENYGVKEVQAHGKEFDPKLEDCVAHEASDDIPENQVIKVMRKGYTLNGRLIRPASVVVSSGKAK